MMIGRLDGCDLACATLRARLSCEDTGLIDDPADKGARPDFAVTLQEDWPPLPGTQSSPIMSSPVLARRLWSLIAKGAAHKSPPLPTRTDNSLPDELDALVHAAQHFRVGSHPLTERLWTRSAHYWSGEIAAKLAVDSSSSAQGFLLLLGTSATHRALLFGRGAPLVVQEALDGADLAEGPHLALILCKTDPTGRAIALSGFVQPVLSAQRFIPVFAPFERDVLHLLLALQEKLDCFGIDSEFVRPYDAVRQNFADALLLAFGRPHDARHELRIILDATTDRPTRQHVSGDFTLGPAQIRDGSFIFWLEQEIGRRML